MYLFVCLFFKLFIGWWFSPLFFLRRSVACCLFFCYSGGVSLCIMFVFRFSYYFIVGSRVAFLVFSLCLFIDSNVFFC